MAWSPALNVSPNSESLTQSSYGASVIDLNPRERIWIQVELTTVTPADRLRLDVFTVMDDGDVAGTRDTTPLYQVRVSPSANAMKSFVLEGPGKIQWQLVNDETSASQAVTCDVRWRVDGVDA